MKVLFFLGLIGAFISGSLLLIGLFTHAEVLELVRSIAGMAVNLATMVVAIGCKYFLD